MKVHVSYNFWRRGAGPVNKIRSVVWEVPLIVTPEAASARVVLRAAPT